MASETPLRFADLSPLSPVDAASDPYAAHLLELLDQAEDLSSWSDELALAAPSWPDSYYFHPARANVLRTLPLVGATILEVSARAGALTRYLGEVGGSVDALEPDPAMAAVAAARCADLRTVQVRVGRIDVVPVEAAYDLIVAVDVVDDIRDSDMTIETFLARCRDLLRPGGRVVLAADNHVGVRYLVGDLAPRLSGATDRATPVIASELETAARAAGLGSVMLSAFPDHRHTQLLFSHEVLASVAPTLITQLPKFVTPPIMQPHVDPTAEKRLWESLVASGASGEHANSLVMVAGLTAPVAHDAAVFWSLGRAASQSACNRVRRDNGVAVIARTRAFPEAVATQGRLRLRPHTEPVIDGESLDHVLTAVTSTSRAALLLTQWGDLVDATVGDEVAISWDLIPRNVMLLADGSMRAIDQEWVAVGEEACADTVRARGCFWLAADLLAAPTLPPWVVGDTVGTVADFLLRLSGSEPGPFWLDNFIAREAEDASWVAPSSPHQSRTFHAHLNRGALMSVSQSGGRDHVAQSPNEPADSASLAALRTVVASVSEENQQLREQVRSLELERRHAALIHRDHVLGITSELETLRERHTSTQRQLRRSRDKANRLQKSVQEMRSSSTWRIGRMLVAPFARLRGSSPS